MPADPPRRYRFEQFAAIRRYQPRLAFSPDGAQIAYSANASGQFNLWRQPTDGGEAVQLTRYDDHAVREIAWSPDGATILYTADREGDEFYQLRLIPAAGGAPTALTDRSAVQHYLGWIDSWSPDGRVIVYAGNDRAPKDQDVLVRELAAGAPRRLFAGDAVYFPVAWSPDGRRLTVIDYVNNSDTNVFVVAVEDGAARSLTPHEGEVNNYAGPWAADGSGFYLLTDEGREFIGLAFQDLRAGERRWLETPEWDVTDVDASADGRMLAWVVNEDGYSRLHVRDLTTGRLLDLPAMPEGVIYAMRVSPNGGKVGFLHNQPDHPSEIVILDLAAGSLLQLTNSFFGDIDPADLIRPELVRFPTHDGRRIPAWLYRPRGEGPFAVVLSIHGGPEGQELPTYAYSGLYQYWLNRGIGVLAPNVRGSTGYGKSYQRLIRRDWGGGELGDLDAAARYLRSLGWVDPDRIGVFGGSFGGFATLSCISRLPDGWAAAVDMFGPSNLVTLA
ncbi:MAG TPA: prolyl oligopeptidase family serine peptidase, partial [Thermomicrobiales bacterium]|nr:prolyl oligopeptidase family serine peptidase [Thermomicrobiales bacterium]